MTFYNYRTKSLIRQSRNFGIIKIRDCIKYTMKIILGSQSEGRARILRQMGYKFEVLNPDIDEKSIRIADPRALTLALAHAKADALLPRIDTPAILITADQVIAWNNTIREKPESADEVRAYLRGYGTHPAETVGAVVVVNTATNVRAGGVDVAKVWFHPIPEEVIETMIQEGDVYRRAGAFSAEEPHLQKYIKKIEGAIDSVMGLPIALTEHLIREIIDIY